MHSSYAADQVVTDLTRLDAIYGEPSKRSLIKELDHLSPHYQAYVAKAPFVVVASVAPEGVDISPRGDAPGFVRVVDAHTLMLPDRRGNNRADTLRNIVRDPRVSLLFLIPGIGESLRVIGTAEVVVDQALCDSFTVQGKAPRSVIVVHVQRAYFQCQKALARSRLWDPTAQLKRGDVPSAGQMLAALDAEFDGESYDRDYPQYMRETMY